MRSKLLKLKVQSERALLTMATTIFERLGERLGVEAESIQQVLQAIKNRYKLDNSYESIEETESKISGDLMQPAEAQLFFIEQLGDDFSRFERNRDMVRFNLYKACLVSL